MSQRLFAILMGLALVAPGVRAQEPASAAPPAEFPSPLYAAAVDGAVSLIRNGAIDTLAASTPLLPGDRIRADAGRAELRSDRGQVVFVDESTVVDVASERALRLVAGAVRVVFRDASGQASDILLVDTPHATARALGAGDFALRVSAGVRADESELRVFDGSVELGTERTAVLVGAGEVSVVRGAGVPSTPVAFEVTRDAFDQWTDARLGVLQPTASASYLPPDLASYSGVLDQNGTWQSVPDYGPVWYPSVSVSWQPYAYGSWGYAGFYGWVWIGQDPWAWPTHHYGRWGWRANRWFWIPGGAWAPAWVWWGVGPGYVGWCPLGWNNRPVFSFHAGHFGYDYRAGSRYQRPGHGWTVLPSQHFRPGVAVSQHAVAYGRLDTSQRSAFVMQRTPPAYRGSATAGAAGRWPAPQVHSAVPRAAGMGAPAVASGVGTSGAITTAPRAGTLSRLGVSRGGTTSPALPTPGEGRDTGDAAAQRSARWPGPSGRPSGAGIAMPRTADPGIASVPQYPPRYIGPGPARRAPESAPATRQYGTPSGGGAGMRSPGYTPPETHYGMPRGGARSPESAPAPRQYGTPSGGGAGMRSPGYTPPETHYGMPRGGARSPESAPAPPRGDVGAPMRAPAGSAPAYAAPDTGRSAPMRPSGGAGIAAPPSGGRSGPGAGAAAGGHSAVPRSGPRSRP